MFTDILIIAKGKLEKWLCSSTMKASEKSVLLSNRVSLKRVKLGQVMDSNGNEVDITDLGMVKKNRVLFELHHLYHISMRR